MQTGANRQSLNPRSRKTQVKARLVSHLSNGLALAGFATILTPLIIFAAWGQQAVNSSDHRYSDTRARLYSIEGALTAYHMENITFPTQAQGLDALVTKPSGSKVWRQIMVPSGIVDGWGRKLIYRNPGTHNPEGYDVFSTGADGKEGTADDIGNW
jgi:general secretion pathway protein G